MKPDDKTMDELVEIALKGYWGPKGFPPMKAALQAVFDHIEDKLEKVSPDTDTMSRYRQVVKEFVEMVESKAMLPSEPKEELIYPRTCDCCQQSYSSKEVHLCIKRARDDDKRTRENLNKVFQYGLKPPKEKICPGCKVNLYQNVCECEPKETCVCKKRKPGDWVHVNNLQELLCAYCNERIMPIEQKPTKRKQTLLEWKRNQSLGKAPVWKWTEREEAMFAVLSQYHRYLEQREG